MKSTTHLLAGALVALLPAFALTAPGVASATPVQLDNPSAAFSDPVQVDPSKDANINYEDGAAEIRFGIPTDNVNNPDHQQSGLRFDVFSAPKDVDVGETFQLGTLSHFNWEVKNGTSITGATLTFTFDISGGDPSTFTIPFFLGVDETANSGKCAYGDPGDIKCPDRITFPDAQSSSTFELLGQTFTLQLLGFGDSPGSLTDEFITQEFADNSTGLWAKISAPTTSVPEPGSLMMMGFGLFGLLGFLGLRRKYATHNA